MPKYFTISIFSEGNGKFALSERQLFGFDFFKEKRNKLYHFVTLTQVKIAKGFVITFQTFSGLVLLTDCT